MIKTINDIDIFYRERGTGNPLVLLHGLAEDHSSFHKLQEDLPNVNSFALDLRGHGKSSCGEGLGTLEQLGNDLIGFLEDVTGPASCLGYSLGGTIVLWVAAKRPDLVERAIVVGTSSRVGHSACDFFRDRITQLSSDRNAFEKALQLDTSAQLVSQDIDIKRLTRSRLDAIGEGAGYINAANAMIALHNSPITGHLKNIRCPVDVIGADADVFCPRKAADIIIDAVNGANYHEISNAGHLISIDQPDSYSKTVQNILNRRSK